MGNNVDFNALAQKFFAARGEETYCDLFSAVFALPEWHFIADGEFPNLQPYCAVFPDFFDAQPMVLAFTDTERLYKYVASKNLQIGSAEKPVVLTSPAATVKFSSENLILSIPTTSVIDYLERLTEKGVKGVFFNPNKDSEGFHLGLPQLRETKALVDSKKPKIEAEKINESPAKTGFDALARKSNESGGALADLNNLFGATFQLEKWLFIARGALPKDPYIAANADYAGGQQMIRAFTDSNRLQRFAKENNLTDADGAAQMLEIPTSGAVEYLEHFIAYGAHGVWFNSDSVSDGYFIPLAQLRPIKEHLAKINWKSINEPTNPDLPHNSGFVAPNNSDRSGESNLPAETILIMVKDGLMLQSGFIKESDYFCDCFCRVPPSWTDGADVTEAARDKLFETLYGEKWKEGNSDGSRYVVRRLNWKVYTPDKAKNFPWNAVVDNNESHFFFFIADDRGKLQKVSKERFVSDINASTPSPIAANTAIDSPPSPSSNLEDYRLSQTPDGEPDLRIKIFKTGNVKFGTSLVPLYSAFAHLLGDYQGSGEFEKIFKFAPEAISNYKESFVANTHGNYFRMQTFQYASPNAVADAMTIDSNQLRHIQTGATLLVGFALLNIPSTSSAALYFGFEGGKSEVEKLLKAVTPALEAAGFVAAQTENNSSAQPAAADENAADYIDWFRRGTIKPDTSFKPFFQAIAPLLADYAGSGEFEFTFATGSDEPGMRDLFEDVSSNSHGAYLKYRSYIFEPYEMQMIGSNTLTNVQTGEKLRIQLTMHKKLAEGKTTLIVVFVGLSATVETLENAVKSALDDAEYKVQLQTKKAATTDTLQSIGVQG